MNDPIDELRRALRSMTAGAEPAAGLTSRAIQRAHRRARVRAASVAMFASLVLVATSAIVWSRHTTPAHRAGSIGTYAPAEPTPATTATDGAGGVSTSAGATTSVEVTVDRRTVNVLVVGADNNSCVDPSSPYAGAFGDRTHMGERSDTIMIARLDPVTHRVALLSFPRDLWVKIHGGATTRINDAYVRDDPTTLILTIKDDFGIQIDHFVQIDFCAFKTIIDAIPGGVGVPFELPARDVNTGLYVPQPGCYYFTGDAALAYVRSRHYQYYKNDRWYAEGLSDLARISRQQDFIRRVVQTAMNKGLFTPSILSGLIDVATQNVTVDADLTLSTMLGYAQVLAALDPASIAGYQIEANAKIINGNAVLLPDLTSANMQAILRIFQGTAPLVPGSPVAPVTASSPTPPPTETPATGMAAQENGMGIVPPRDVTCP